MRYKLIHKWLHWIGYLYKQENRVCIEPTPLHFVLYNLEYSILYVIHVNVENYLHAICTSRILQNSSSLSYRIWNYIVPLSVSKRFTLYSRIYKIMYPLWDGFPSLRIIFHLPMYQSQSNVTYECSLQLLLLSHLSPNPQWRNPLRNPLVSLWSTSFNQQSV